jgi:hypothetical protein
MLEIHCRDHHKLASCSTARCTQNYHREEGRKKGARAGERKRECERKEGVELYTSSEKNEEKESEKEGKEVQNETNLPPGVEYSSIPLRKPSRIAMLSIGAEVLIVGGRRPCDAAT